MARRETFKEAFRREQRIEDEEEQHNIRVINNFQASLDTSSGSSVDLRVIPMNERVASIEESTDSWRIDHRARFYRDTAAILNIDIPSSIQGTEASASSLGSPSIASSGEEQRVVIEIRVEAPGSVAPKGVTVHVVHSDLQQVRVYSEEDSCDQVTEQDATEETEEVVRICAKREEAWKFEIKILNTDPAKRQAEADQQEERNKRQRLDR